MPNACPSAKIHTQPTDKTRFDDWLKERLHRDLAFRAIFWLIIAGTAALLSGAVRDSNPIAYFERVSNSVLPVVDVVGTFGLALCILALMLKHLEHIAPNEWGYSTRQGGLGGVVRRAAGDITLWAVGSLMAVLAIAIVAIVRSAGTSAEAWGAFVLLSPFAAVTALTAIANVLVRRGKAPPWSDVFKKPNLVFASYLAIVFFVLFLQVFRRR